MRFHGCVNVYLFHQRIVIHAVGWPSSQSSLLLVAVATAVPVTMVGVAIMSPNIAFYQKHNGRLLHIALKCYE